jgi:hypothetical protein
MSAIKIAGGWWKVSSSGGPFSTIVTTQVDLMDCGMIVVLRGLDWSTVKPADSIHISCLLVITALQYEQNPGRLPNPLVTRFLETLEYLTTRITGVFASLARAMTQVKRAYSKPL